MASTEETAPPLEVGAVGNGSCAACGKAFTTGVAIKVRGGDILAAFCIWCIQAAQDMATGYDHTRLLVTNYVQKRYYRKVKELGWTGSSKHKWGPDPHGTSSAE